MASARFDELLTALASGEVEFIVVGMLAGVLQGTPLTTRDVDIVHRRTVENVQRLGVVLKKLNAVYRHDPRRLAPGASHLLGPGHQLLETDLGELDCLGEIHDGLGYDELVDRTVRLDLGDALSVRVVTLDKLIELKRAAGRPKDLAALPVLEATLDEQQRRSRGD
jgi:hypothetical protein